MKANEFIKKFGWDEAKAFLSFDGDVEIVYTASFFDDLKRIVESHELVEKHGGIDSLNDLFCVHGMRSVRLMAVGSLTHARAMQAIADMESCQ